jgi:uncharacterized membrane protein YecN with MAPEG domain
MRVAIACVCVFGLLIFGLGSAITYVRVLQNKYDYNATNSPTDFLTKLSRAHGNTAEFTPILAVMMLYLGAQHPSNWVLSTMVLVTISRVLVVAGFLTCKTLQRMHPVKAIGAAGTYIFGLALTFALIVT